MSTTSNATTAAKTNATKRSTAAKKAAEARKRSTAAKKAAETRRELAKTPVDKVVETAERAVLVPVGAALVARDSVKSTVDGIRTTYGSREKAERELQLRRRRLEAELKRFERRGATARTNVERDLKKARTRVESDLKGLRTDVTKQATSARKDVTTQAEFVTARVENLVQTGITAGTKTAAKVQERFASVA